MYSYSKFEHIYAKSKINYKLPLSHEFRVRVNGEDIPVYTCRISAFPFNRVWPGFQRSTDQTITASFVNLVSDEEIHLEVEAECSEKVIIKPYSKAIEHIEKDGKICFSLKENGQFVLECGSHQHLLYIFNSKPIAAPKKDEVTYFFGPGIHFPGKIILNSGDSIYADKDAYIYGCVYAENAENIHIFGNGIFDDANEARIGNYCYGEYTNGNMKFYDCQNIKIEGVGILDSAIWCLNLFHCKNVSVHDIKIFGQWKYNTDGIDIVNSCDIFIENSFIHSFDDTITIKGIDRYCRFDNKNIRVKNCVLWCDWGKCCEIGIETNCREYSGISFSDCDILNGGSAALDISNGYSASISDIVFENINIDFNDFDTEPQLQESDEMRYSRKNTHYFPLVLQIRNSSWLTPETTDIWGITLSDAPDMSGLVPHMIQDITVKNIHVHCDSELLRLFGKDLLLCHIKSSFEDVEYRNIKISEIFLNGESAELLSADPR